MATLYEQYTQAGQKLPSVQERQGLATQAGISGYTGTAEQNTALGNYITSNKVDLTKPINASNLNTPKLDIPTPPTPAPVNITGTNTTIAGIDNSIKNAQTQAQTQATTGNETDKFKSLFETYMGEQNAIAQPSSEDTYTKLYNDLGLKQAGAQSVQDQQEYDVLQAELQGITDRATQKNLAIENQGANVTTGGVARMSAQNVREAAIEALPVQSKILLAQAKATGSQNALKLAQDNLNTLFSIKSKDAENAYNYKIKTLDSLYDYANDSETRALNAKKEEATLAYNEKKDLLDYKKSFIPELIKSGQASLIDDLNNAKTVEEVNSLASKIKVATTAETPTIKSINGKDYQYDEATGQWFEPFISGTTGKDLT